MNKFFRFPLRALAAFETPLQRLEKIVGFCVMDAGAKVVKKRGGDVADFREIRESGCQLLEVQCDGKRDARAMHKDYQALLRACGRDPQATVSIAAPFFWNCLHTLRGETPGKPLSYREFSVLCAVLSKVGRKDFVSCSWREVRRRALGYMTERELLAGLPMRCDAARPLSRQQLRTTLDDLDRCGFFVRYVVGNGRRCFLSYYSVRMNPQQLAEAATRAYCARRREVVPMTPAARAAQAVLWRRFRQP